MATPAPTTVSTSAAETVQGKHVFRVVGYSQHKGRGGSDGFVWSGLFSVGGHDWAIGFSNDVDMRIVFILLKLATARGGATARASYDLRLVDQTTGLSCSVQEEDFRTFHHDETISEPAFYVDSHSLFEATNSLRDDCLTIECVVTVVREPVTSETKSFPKIEVPPPNITDQFGRLLEEKEGADVAFVVGGEAFTAHKIVLATRSPVFNAELYGPMRKTGTEPITIEDLQPDVFRALLRFIYTDSLPAMDDLEEDDRCEMVRHLLVAADRYDIERLKLICQSILCDNLHVRTVATTLALANQHHCDMLKDACLEFITCSNAMSAVVETPGYNNLKRSCPSVVIEAFERATKTHKA
ncbi:hypothetical protein ACP4OV_026911 [Aristida adscensionis]